MQCKQCGEAFSSTEAHDIWEIRRQYVALYKEGESRKLYLEDAGVFCSRGCVREYLGGGNKSGIFNLKKPSL